MFHAKLIDRLHTDYGYTGSALAYIYSYLGGPSQVVQVGSALRSKADLVLCVPQGLVLGPLFFLSYVAPAASLISDLGLAHIAYADDLTLYFDASWRPDKSVDDFAACALLVHNWFLHNDLMLNPSMSDPMYVGSKTQLKHPPGHSGRIASSRVPLSTSVKLLGVTFDPRMTFDSHVTDICRVAQHRVRTLQHVRALLDISYARLLATALIGSKLDCYNSVLTGLFKNTILRLQRVQNSHRGWFLVDL